MQNLLRSNNKNIVLYLFLVLIVSIISCTNEQKENGQFYQCPMKCEGEKTYSKTGNCPECGMKLVNVKDLQVVPADSNSISDVSIFNLDSRWKTQDNNSFQLKDLQGNAFVVVMIYASCQAACPRLVADVRNIRKDVENESVKYVFVSIDPENDTPEKLTEFAKENDMYNEESLFLTGSQEDVLELANVLAVKYKEVSPMLFSHSNIISVFDKGGNLKYQREGLGVNNTEIIKEIKKLTS